MTSVAAAGDVLYAVSLDGVLVQIANSGELNPSCAWGLDRPHAVARDGTLYLAGAILTGGTLRRLAPNGALSTLISNTRVSDVAGLPDGDL